MIYCEAVGEGMYKQIDAQDGTRCRSDSLDVCVAGRCEPVGCDGQLYSTAVLDQCGVCNGDGTSCKAKTGTHNVRHLGKKYQLIFSLVFYVCLYILRSQ